jgi:hypothetical protein
MAGLKFTLGFEDVALVANTWVTLVSARAPTNQMAQLLGLKLAGSGVAGDAKPVSFRMRRVTAGSGTGTTVAAQKTHNAISCNVQTVGRNAFSAAPSDDAGAAPYMFPDKFHPQGGIINSFEFDDVYVKEATELAVEAKLAASETVISVSGHIHCEE